MDGQGDIREQPAKDQDQRDQSTGGHGDASHVRRMVQGLLQTCPDIAVAMSPPTPMPDVWGRRL
jgi:hypothetical protein